MALGAARNLGEGGDSMREELRMQYEGRVANTLKRYPEGLEPPGFDQLVLEEQTLQAIGHMENPALLLYINRKPWDIAGQIGCKKDFGAPFLLGGFFINPGLVDRGRVTSGFPVFIYERDLPHGGAVSYYPRRTELQMYDGQWRAQVADAGEGDGVIFEYPERVVTRSELDFSASHELLKQGLQPMGDLADYLELVKSCKANGENIDLGATNFTALGSVRNRDFGTDIVSAYVDSDGQVKVSNVGGNHIAQKIKKRGLVDIPILDRFAI